MKPFIISLDYAIPTKDNNCQPINVYTDLCADLFHYGHMNFLRQCSDLYPNTNLIVGIHSDATIASYKRAPIMTMNERIRAVAACRYANQIIANAPLKITAEYMDEFDLQMIVHADEIDDDTRDEWYSIPIQYGRYCEVKRTVGVSTTDIINRIIKRSHDHKSN